jgi:hypothetical protein
MQIKKKLCYGNRRRSNSPLKQVVRKEEEEKKKFEAILITIQSEQVQ